jgi:TonB family protein
MKTKTSSHRRARGSQVIRWCRSGAICVVLAAWQAPLTAQNRLYVEGSDDNFHAVCKVSGGRPYILENGRAVATNGNRFALKKIDEFLPIFITVSGERVTAANMDLAGADDYHNNNNQLHYSAKFESADAMDDVFIALELEVSNVGKQIYVYEVGHLEARTSKPLDLILPTGQYQGAGKITIHLFVAGTEVLQSGMTEEYRQEQLDRMVAKRAAALKPAAPKPFFGSMPAYPAALQQSGLKGKAVVNMRVSAQGRVLDPVVDSASEPPFGEEALAAVRQWRFLPRVVDGQPVETRVSMPFAFEPPPGGR